MNQLQTPISPYTIPGIRRKDRPEWRRNIIHKNEQQQMGEVLKIVSEFFGITEEQIKGVRRLRDIVTARKAFCHICFKELYIACKRVGRFINKDHTSVLHLVRVYQNERDTIPFLKVEFDTLLAKIF